MRNRAIQIALVIATCMACLYSGASYYYLLGGVAISEQGIKAVLIQADEIYNPIVSGELLWSFPFSDEVHWRIIRRGSRVELTGAVAQGSATEFLELVDQPTLSSETFPTESGRFRLIIEEALIEGSVDELKGSFRMDICPVLPRD